MDVEFVIGPGFLSLGAVVFFWRRRKRPWDPFSPLRFFTACWFGAIGLTQLRLLPDHPEWSAATWCAIFLGIGSFWFGGLTALFASRACVAHADAPVGQNSVELKPQLWRQWDRYPLVPILRGLIVLSIGVLLLEFYLNGIPILDPTLEVRMTVGINSYVHKISLALIPYSIAYGVFLLQQREARNRVVVADVAVIMLALAMIVALDSRFFLANVFVVWVVSYHYLRRSLSRRAFVVFAIVAGLVLVSGRALIHESTARPAYHLVEALDLPSVSAVLLAAYIPLVMSFVVLDNTIRAVTTPEQWLYGIRGTFDFLTAFARESFGVDLTNEQFAVELYQGRWNIATHLGVLYADFGLLGVFIGSTLTGFIAVWAYQRMLVRPTTFRVATYGMLVFVLLWSLMQILITTLGFIYNLALLKLVDFVAGGSGAAFLRSDARAKIPTSGLVEPIRVSRMPPEAL